MADDIPDTGAVFTFGKSHFADNEPSHFFIKNDPIVAISCGDEHSAVICQNGRVFVFGGNAWGQLGLGHRDEAARPSCVKWLKPHRALFVACGRAHTVFVTDTHSIYTVGCNEEGQLGTGDTEAHTVPQYVEVDCEDLQVKQVSAGSNHTAILTETGRVFVCGSNSEGQLGLGDDTRSCLKFTELTFVEKIAFVECGYYHTVFITAKGAVFVTGENEGKKLGVSEAGVNVYVPVVLPLEMAIKSVCCGAAHTFLLTMDETKVLALGSNEAGQLGLSSDHQWVTEPTELQLDNMFEGYQLKLVACGAMHTAFVTDNGLLYTCGESRHNKLCLDEIDNAGADDAGANQYLPKRVNAMNGFVVDNVACGGCHTLLSATKEADMTASDLVPADEPAQPVALIELPPLLKVPASVLSRENSHPGATDEVNNLDGGEPPLADTSAVPSAPDDNGSIDSLEANVSGSHIVNINDLDNDNHSEQGLEELKDDTDPTVPIDKSELKEIIDNMENLADKTTANIEDGVNKVKEDMQTKMEAIEDIIEKAAADIDPCKHCDERKILDVPNDIITEVANSPPPKSPILQELLHVPDLTQLSDLSKMSDDGQRSESGSKSENETIPCGSDKSSPQAGKTAKTQAVMPTVRSEDAVEATDPPSETQEDGEIVVSKLDQGRFGRFFQSIRDKENSCMGKGKVIEENVQETVTKGIGEAEKTIHKVEETIETEIRNQTNSRTCAIL